MGLREPAEAATVSQVIRVYPFEEMRVAFRTGKREVVGAGTTKVRAGRCQAAVVVTSERIAESVHGLSEKVFQSSPGAEDFPFDIVVAESSKELKGTEGLIFIPYVPFNCPL